MSLEYIRHYYRVPANLGAIVEFAWPKDAVQVGPIVGASGAHLLVDFGGSSPAVLHPTWRVTYRPESVGVGDDQHG
jgi:hypothetical protein